MPVIETMLLAVIILTSGIIFYWFSWILWIIITFFMQKSKKRTILACWLLLSIICLKFYMVVDGFHFSIALLLVNLGSLLLIIQHPRLKYYLFSSFTITIGYTAMLLWEINVPVWVILPRLITIPLLLGVITMILAKDFYIRLGIGLLGMSIGELVYHFILSSYGLHTMAGDLVFFDCLLSVVVFQVIIKLLHQGNIALFYSFQSLRRPIRKL